MALRGIAVAGVSCKGRVVGCEPPVGTKEAVVMGFRLLAVVRFTPTRRDIAVLDRVALALRARLLRRGESLGAVRRTGAGLGAGFFLGRVFRIDLLTRRASFTARCAAPPPGTSPIAVPTPAPTIPRIGRGTTFRTALAARLTVRVVLATLRLARLTVRDAFLSFLPTRFSNPIF